MTKHFLIDHLEANNIQYINYDKYDNGCGSMTIYGLRLTKEHFLLLQKANGFIGGNNRIENVKLAENKLAMLLQHEQEKIVKRKNIPKQTRLKVYEKYKGHCAYCGTAIEYKQMQVDHLVALRRIENNEFKNLMPACRSCNHYKSTLTLDGFRQALEKQPDVLQRDSVTYRIAVRFGTVIPNKKKIIFYFEKELI